MNPQRARRLLILAFALSLLIHLILATGIRWPFGPSKEQVATVERIEHVRALRIARQTPPPKTPPPVTPSPHPPAPAATPNPKKAKPAGGRGIGPPSGPGAPPTAPPSPAPTPKATATPNCATADTAAFLAESPPPPEIAPDARGAATSGTAKVRVALDANGAVQQTTVVQSSGNTSLDLVAVTMARDARYTPATHACKPIASNYIFSAKFVAW